MADVPGLSKLPVRYRAIGIAFAAGLVAFAGSVVMLPTFSVGIGANTMFAVYLASMVFYSFLQPKPADPAQAQQQKMMVFMMPVMFGWFMCPGSGLRRSCSTG